MLKKDVASALNLSPSMVSRLAKMGMPVDSLEAARRWRERNLETMRRKEFRALSAPRVPAVAAAGAAPPPATPALAGAVGEMSHAEAKRREAVANALQAERDLAERAGDLIPREQLLSMFIRRRPAVRDALLTLSDRIAPLVAAETDVARCAALIDEEVNRVLNALAELGQAIETYPKDHHEDDSQEPGRA